MDERMKAIFSAFVVIIINAAALIGVDLGDGTDVQDAMLAAAWLVSIFWAIWKNHNFTDAAAEGQRVLDLIKRIEKESGQTLTAEAALELTDGVGNDVQ